ncbi:MAG: hypothetical protein LBJ20_04225 [Candidatus Methanoplasma sp.]|jgi:methionine-rich copper-binding protein CopC|nr:hypothetical protein [Candidatus Methanoplasma sp.]
MEVLGKTMAVLAIASAVALFALPVLSPSADAASETVKIYYREDQNINVDFPDGIEIGKGGELTVVVSSQRYDMAKSGIMFYERDSDGNVDMTSSVHPDHTSVADGNTVTHVFRNIVSDIEMSFSDLVELEPQNSEEEGTDSPRKDTAELLDSTTVVTAMSVVLAAVLLAAIVCARRNIDSIVENRSGSHEN